MTCSNCGKKIKRGLDICPECGAEVARKKKDTTPESEGEPKRKQKTKKLGNFALIFAFLLPVVGIVLGVLSIVFSRGDKRLFKDGVIAIVMSVVVTVVWVIFFYVLELLGILSAFIFM